jgi:antirestriction protein
MTWKPEQIAVSGAEVAEFKRLIEEGHGTGFALAAFLAARMPEKDESETYRGTGNSDDDYKAGCVDAYNAALDQVARGK